MISLVEDVSQNSRSIKKAIAQGKRNGRYHAKHIKDEWCLCDSYSAEGKKGANRGRRNPYALAFVQRVYMRTKV